MWRVSACGQRRAGLLLGDKHDAQAKIVDLEIRVAAEAVGDSAVLRAAEPAAATDDVKLAFRADRIHDAVAIRIRDDFVLPFAGVDAPFPNVARHVVQAELIGEFQSYWLRADVGIFRMPCDVVDDVAAAVRIVLGEFSAAGCEFPLRFGGKTGNRKSGTGNGEQGTGNRSTMQRCNDLTNQRSNGPTVQRFNGQTLRLRQQQSLLTQPPRPPHALRPARTAR